MKEAMEARRDGREGVVSDLLYDDDEAGDDTPSDEQLAKVGDLVAAQAEVASIGDRRERHRAARRYHALLEGTS